MRYAVTLFSFKLWELRGYRVRILFFNGRLILRIRFPGGWRKYDEEAALCGLTVHFKYYVWVHCVWEQSNSEPAGRQKSTNLHS